jgi:hypothetical protein
VKTAFIAGLLAMFAPAAASAQAISVGAGGSYSSGRYGGTDRVEVASTYVSVGATRADWRLDATFPYLFVRTGGSAVDAGGIVLPGEGRRSASGLGDATLRLSGPLPLEAPVTVTVGAQVKLPTGSREVSTGQVDASADVEISREMGRLTPFASAAYRAYGDSIDLELENGWTLSAGSSLSVGTTALILSYDWSQSAVGGPASQELFAVAAGRLTPRLGWTLYGSKGLSSGAADFLLGAGVTRSFGPAPVDTPRRTPRL